VLKIGACAVLCVAVSPDNSRMAVGCLDQRCRVYSFSNTADSTELLAVNQVGDWGGFDGPVRNVLWSENSEWLSCTGGSVLMCVQMKEYLKQRDVPILCALPFTKSDEARSEKYVGSGCPQKALFSAMAWCCTEQKKRMLLAAMTWNLRGECICYDVVNGVEESVPRRALPLMRVVHHQHAADGDVGFDVGGLGLLEVEFVRENEELLLVWTCFDCVHVHLVKPVE